MDVMDMPSVDPNIDYEKSCESRLMEFEYKLQKIEASILILESQLSSISSLNKLDDSNRQEVQLEPQKAEVVELPVLPSEAPSEPLKQDNATGPKPSEDPRFIKFFKMVQFGVPIEAVKNKMALEGFDPTILDKPNEVVPGCEANPISSSNSSTS